MLGCEGRRLGNARRLFSAAGEGKRGMIRWLDGNFDKKGLSIDVRHDVQEQRQDRMKMKNEDRSQGALRFPILVSEARVYCYLYAR